MEIFANLPEAVCRVLEAPSPSHLTS